MNNQFVDVADHYPAFYQALLAQAAQAGESIMGAMISTARKSIQGRVPQMRGFGERDHLELTLMLLDSHATALCENYPQALRKAFKQASQQVESAPVVLAIHELHFDQLELMDSDQVHVSVALARSQQSVMLAAEASLSELNTYICATLGLKSVQTERNPLRPEIYVRALQEVLVQTKVPSLVQMDWLQHMSAALGQELSLLYTVLSQELHREGVTPAGYTVIRSFDGAGPSSAIGADVGSAETFFQPRGQGGRERQETVLTLDRLRRLLVGELDQRPQLKGLDAFAAQFSREFELEGHDPINTDFQSTVPAALEALQEMKQVDRLVERIDKRRHGTPVNTVGQALGQSARGAMRDQMRRAASGLGQALSLEVVSLMVENIARDARMLDPIKEVIKNLEPALLKLALVDPRFFSDKQHPARRLLEEITHRSLAFETPESQGLTEFLAPLQQTVGSLSEESIEDAGIFEQVLQQLIQVWDAGKRAKQQSLELAMQALQQAEKRSLVAEKVAKEIRAKSTAATVDSGVLDFLCGPWAQVVAHAQMANLSEAIDPGQYRELIVPLLWSAQPDLTRKDIAKLTRLVPKLLAKLREGLHLIDYPPVKTSVFFELLMNLQQQAFRPQTPLMVAAKTPVSINGLLPSLLHDDDPWLAPEEAKASGFMELPEEITQQPGLASVHAELQEASVSSESLIDMPVVLSPEVALPVGAWVELMVNGVWVRTQLSWASPHGTLFLFTSAYGSTQSMSKRSRDKLIATGTMRVVSGLPVVQGALDAVVQAAILNSLDVKP